MQEQVLRQSIEEGVSKGVSMDFMFYSLVRAGWPVQVVRTVIMQWQSDNGRNHPTTSFTIWLKKYYHQARPAVLLMVLLNLVSAAFTLLQPWPLKIMADSVFGSIPAPGPLRALTHTPQLVLVLSLSSLLIYILKSGFDILKDYSLLRISYWLNRSIKEESFRHILHLPLYHPGRLAKGDYIYRQNEVTNSLSDLVLNSVSTIIGSIILIFGVIAIMLTLNVRLTLIAVVVIPFLTISVRIIGPMLAKWGQAFAILASKSASLIAESIDNAETVQAFMLQERQVDSLKHLWDGTFLVARMGLLWSKALSFSNDLVVYIGTACVMYFGGTEALNGQFSLGKLFIFITYLGFLIGPVQQITSQITIRRQKLVNVRRVYEVLSDHEGIEYIRQDKPLRFTQGKIEFQNVSFVEGGTVILDRVNLIVQPGEKVGIIGPSGSGKSTFLKLLNLYLEPTAGRILIDGTDIQSVSLEDIRRHIGWVSQSPELFATTILDNMRDGDITRRITPEEIAWASAASNVSEFVGRLPNGLDSIAGEAGSRLSGGQRQRISIARALLKNAPIICMDEPTSALDEKSERLVIESIRQLIEHKSVLLVTHRLPLLTLMNKVYVMQRGQLVDVAQFGGINNYLNQLDQAGNM